MSELQVAFIAVRAGPGPLGGNFEAVVVGATADGMEWRYARFPLHRFVHLLKDLAAADENENAVHPLADQSNESNLKKLRSYDLIEAPRIAITQEWELPDIVRCVFYRRDGDIVTNSETGPPLAVLETCRAYDAEGNSDPLPPSVGPIGADPAESNKLVSSRLFVAPADSTRPGSVKQFRLALQIRMPLAPQASSGTQPDSFDARALLTLSAHQTGGKSLWCKQASMERGACFDQITLALTQSSWMVDKNNGRQSVSWENRDLGAFGRRPDEMHLFLKRDLIYWKNWWPLALTPWAAGLAEMPRDSVVSRKLGFRPKFDKYEKEVLSLHMRLEITIWNSLSGLKSEAADILPRSIRGLTDGAWQLLTVAQEQPRGVAANGKLAPLDEVRWLLTIRTSAVQGYGKKIWAGVAAQVTASAEKLSDDLRGVQDAMPLSFVPELSCDELGDWQLAGLMLDRNPHDRILFKSLPSDPGRRFAEVADRSRLEFAIFLKTFEPVPVKDFWIAQPARVRVIAGAQFPRFHLTAGVPAQAAATLSASTYLSADSAEISACAEVFQPAFADAVDLDQIPIGTFFGIHVAFPKAEEMLLETDVSAFRFLLLQGAPAQVGTAPWFDWQGTLQMRPMPTAQRNEPKLTHGLDVNLKFAVDRIMPAADDEPVGADRYSAAERIEGLRDRSDPSPDAPLFMFMGKVSPAGSVGRYALVARDSITRGENHTATLALRVPPNVRSVDSDFGERQVLACQQYPFRMMLVEYTEPATEVDDQNSEVAVWNAAGEGGVSWRMADKSQQVRLAGPPQVIAEAMEKNPSTSSELPPDILPGRAAAARFGSVTRLNIDPTYFDTRFREPGWNLRRTLGYAGQRSPGARLRDLRAELLYGMTTRVTPIEPVFITEIAGAIGVLATQLKETGRSERGVFTDYLRLSRQMMKIERSRPAVEKLWQRYPDELLTLEEGVRSRLRTRQKGKGPLTKLRWPVPGQMPSEPVPPLTSQVLDETFSTDPDDAKSFPGGLAWAFESANILMSVYGTPESEGGRVSGLHLSALGGWGSQRALFDDKKTTIENETTQGRVQRYALERVGRIGGLWHRAKHVIVYERTVVPSAQFYNEMPIGKGQDALTGRPVLRKVEEYIEILQPMRRYPEDSTSVTSAGCLVGAEFKSRRIRVDSRWGRDVRREGWQVPLWNKAFADLPPTTNNPDAPALIYPKPQIRLVLAAEGGGEVSVEIDEPEKLGFYTSIVRGESGDDTDAWRPVREVDFIDVPPPMVANLPVRSSDLSDAILPAEPAHVAGYELMTIGLVRSGERIAVAHGRIAGQGPAAVLRNVTIARAKPSSATGERLEVAAARALAQSAVNLRAELDRAVGQVLAEIMKFDARDALDISKLRDAAKRKVDAALASVEFKEVDGLRAAADQLADLPVVGASDRVGKIVGEALQVHAQRAQVVLEQLFADLNAQFSRTRDQLIAAIDEIKKAPSATWVATRDRLDASLAGISGQVQQRQADLTVIRASSGRKLNNLRAEFSGSLNKSVNGLSFQARAFVGLLEDLKLKVDPVANGPGLPAPWAEALIKAKSVLGEYMARLKPMLQAGGPGLQRTVLLQLMQLGSAAEVLLAEITQADETARQALMDRLTQTINGLSTLVTALDSRVGDLEAGLTLIEEAIQAKLDEFFLPLLGDVGPPSSPGLFKATVAQIALARAALRDLPGPPARWDELDQAEIAVSAVATEVKNKLLLAESAAEQLLSQVEQHAQNLKSALVQSFKSLEDAYQQSGIAQGAQWVTDNLDLQKYKAELKRQSYAAIDAIAGAASEVVADLQRRLTAELAAVAKAWESKAQQFAAAAQEKVREVLGVDPVALGDKAQNLYQQGSQTLQLLRCLSEGPRTDVSQVLNRPEVALIYKELSNVVDLSPVVALANRAGDLIHVANAADQILESFGVRSPLSAIGESLIPARLKGLSFANFCPDIAGLDIRGLLMRSVFPDIDPLKAINMRHGFEPSQMRAWMEADLDVPFNESTVLMEFGPVQIVIDSARFWAKARVTTDRDGTRQAVEGRISGDWRVTAGGQTVLTFRQTGLHFDESGKLDFRTSPEKVEVAEALRFLTDLLSKTGKGGGLKVGPLMRGPVPAGVAATLDLKLPDIQTGVFGVSDLSLHVLFGVAAIPEFELLCDLSIGSRMAPFSINVWILNGGGYITQRLSFQPAARPSPVMTYVLDIGIVAGVGLGFSFGVVSGGVWLQVGCAVAITWTTAEGGGSTTVRVFILARGNVDVAGLITASIALMLEVSYDGDLMLGAGTLSISAKISMFYTLRVNQRVEYVFAGKKKAQSSGDYIQAYE